MPHANAAISDAPPPPPVRPGLDPAELATCLRVLRQLSGDPALAGDSLDVSVAISRAYKRVRKHRRKGDDRAGRKGDRAKAENTERILQDPRPAELLGVDFTLDAPDAPNESNESNASGESGESGESNPLIELAKPRICYVCKAQFRRLHAFYHQLCPPCADENFARRTARADLTGRRAIVTGGRIKIGYQQALMMLRDGAEVIVTTRFPRDAADRYAREPDFAAWGHRLTVCELDLRSMPAVYAFADRLNASLDSLDILVNNAAQTIRRDPVFYRSLYDREAGVGLSLTAAAQSLLGEASTFAGALASGAQAAAAEAAAPAAGRSGDARLTAMLDASLPTSHVPASASGSASASAPELWHWPDDLAYDAAGRPRDARPVNSWMLEMADVGPVELAEVMLVNAMAPFALCGRLEPLLRASRFADRHIVNVSAMEGKFARGTKTHRHPHTNMAKAALNMLTRTAAKRLARDRIYMNSVDTGWVTEENPHPKRVRLRTEGFVPPLDEVDGAARVYDPILRGVAGHPVFGLFLKDYRPVSW